MPHRTISRCLVIKSKVPVWLTVALDDPIPSQVQVPRLLFMFFM